MYRSVCQPFTSSYTAICGYQYEIMNTSPSVPERGAPSGGIVNFHENSNSAAPPGASGSRQLDPCDRALDLESRLHAGVDVAELRQRAPLRHHARQLHAIRRRHLDVPRRARREQVLVQVNGNESERVGRPVLVPRCAPRPLGASSPGRARPAAHNARTASSTSAPAHPSASAYRARPRAGTPPSRTPGTEWDVALRHRPGVRRQELALAGACQTSTRAPWRTRPRRS